ncbi:MAG: putative 2OG-Fe(II) oxygenase [Alphaproteobacteria bacterium]
MVGISLHLRHHAREKVGDNPDLLLSEASARIHMNDAAEAAACLEHASGIAPDRADISAELGRAYSVLNRNEEAVAAYERADSLSGGAGFYRQGYGASLLRAGQSGRAISVLEEAHLKDPADQLVLGTLTTALREAGDPRYKTLVDIDKYVRTYNVALPAGFGDAEAFNRALVEELARFHTRKIEPFDQSLRGGSQTTGHLFRENSRLISLLRGSLSECVAQYIRDLPNDPTHPTAQRKSGAFDFVGAWSCSLNNGGHHINHVHSQGWISSAYYVQLPGSVANNTSNRQGWLMLGRSGFDLNPRDATEAYVQPVVGRLVLFPSFYWHGTIPFTSDEARVTVAFDVVPT